MRHDGAKIEMLWRNCGMAGETHRLKMESSWIVSYSLKIGATNESEIVIHRRYSDRHEYRVLKVKSPIRR